MKLKLYITVVFLMVAFLANIPAIAVQGEINQTFEPDFTNTNNNAVQIKYPESVIYPLKDWISDENKYWQEQSKNDYLLSLLSKKDNSKLNNNYKISYDYYADQKVINIDLDKLFYQSGDSVNFVIQVTQNLQAVSGYSLIVEIFDRSDNFFYQYGGYFYRYDNDITPYKTFTVTTNSQGFYSGSFDAENSGQYAIYVSEGGSSLDYYYYSPSAYRSITVSDLALYSRLPYYYIPSQPITGYSIVLNGSSFVPLSDVSVNVSYYTFNWQQETANLELSWIGTTDSTGKIKYNIPTDFTSNYWGYLVITAKKDNSSASSVRSIWSSYYYKQSNGYEFVPTLDKPIYQPSETILGRALVWENDYLTATKTPAQIAPVTIQFLSPDTALLMQFERVTDDNGIVTFEIPLDDSIATGTYKIVFKKGNFQQLIDVPVDYYEKPAFRVIINLDHEYVPSGNHATGNVSVQYYFGKPVSNAEVLLKLENSQGKILKTVSGKTNSKGYFNFDIPVTVSKEETQLKLSALATDPVGREVSAESSIITISNIYMWSWAYPWTPSVDDEIKISYYVFQGYYSYYDYGYWMPPKALENAKVVITIKGINSGLFNIIANETVKEIISETNSYGYGRESFKLDRETVLKYEYFEIYVILELDDGRSGASKSRLEYSKLLTDLTFDKEYYQKGDQVVLSVSVKDLEGNPGKANVRLSIFDADYDTIYRGYIEISDSEEIYLQLTDLAPEGMYTIYTTISYNVLNDYGYNVERYVFGGYSFFKVGQHNPFQISADKNEYSVGETITISGNLTETTLSSPVYYEITKRGLLSSDSFSLMGNSFEIILEDTEYLAPKITILFVSFTSSGVILETYLVITIKQELKLEITSNKDIYEPGENAQITIKLKNNNDEGVNGVAVISLIDSSVFGVHEDPEWEVEHFNTDNYWSIMSTSTNWRGFQPMWYYYWYWLDDIAFSSSSIMGGFEEIDVAFDSSPRPTSAKDTGGQALDTSQIELRDDLPESMNWLPRVLIPVEGYSFTRTLPDNIGEWTVRVTATKGQMGVLEKHTFVTQLPFFVEIEKPATAMQDDIVTIKGIFYNYLSDDIDVNVSISVDNAVVLNREDQSITIPQDYLSHVKWSVYLPESGRHNVTIYALTSSNDKIHSDAIRKQIIVLTNGVEEKQTSSGFIDEEGVTINLESFEEADSKRQYIVISKGLEDVVLDSWERLVGYPYGCLEQTMSKLLPDILIKNYLTQKGELTEEIGQKLDSMIGSGVTRIYSMQKTNGGFGWWGSNDESNIYMTAYAIYGLNKLQEYGYPVSKSVMKSAVAYLQNIQSPDGHWKTNYWRMSENAFTSFVIKNLISINVSEYSGLDATILNGLNYIKGNWDNESSSVYTAGLILLSTFNTSYWDESFGDSLLQFIFDNQKADENGIYWAVDNNNYYWRPLGGNVETTATIMQMLTKIDYSQYNSIISSSLNWLLNKQKPWGWSNTKGTAEAITTIIDLLSYVSGNNSGTVELIINGNIENIFILDQNSDIKPFDISNLLTVGNNEITLTGSEGTKFTYYIDSVQILRTNPEIEFNSKPKANPNSNVVIPIKISPTSENVFITDFKISLLEEDWLNNSALSFNEGVLLSSKIFNFNLQSSSDLGMKVIKGFKVDYYLTNTDGSISSPGLISQIFGPIKVVVTNEQINVNNNNLNFNKQEENVLSIINKVNVPTNSLKLVKSYDKVSQFLVGDFVSVTLTLTSIQDINNKLLFIEDQIPSGFIIDETSLNDLSEILSYSLSSNKISFFLNSINEEETISWSYRLQAKEHILSSLAPAAFVASMYDDDNKAYSERFVLGENLVRKDVFGNIFRDLDLPTLLKYSYQSSKANTVSFSVDAQDDEGIGLVKVYYNNFGWSSQELNYYSENTWNGEIIDLVDSQLEIYIEIHDKTGNVYVSDKLVIEIIVTVIIPVLIFTVLLIAGTAGVGGYITTKRKLWKK